MQKKLDTNIVTVNAVVNGAKKNHRPLYYHITKENKSRGVQMIFWKGRDIDVFLEILESVEQGQVIEVSTENGATKTVSTFDDVRALLPPRNEHTEITKQEYEEILRVFMKKAFIQVVWI